VKVLLIRFSSAGDILLTRPLVEKIKKAGHTIFLLVKKKFIIQARLAEPHRIYTYAGQKGELKNLVRKLNREKFGMVIDLQKNLRSFYVSFFTAAPVKRAYKKSAFMKRLMVAFKWIPRKTRRLQERYLDTVRDDPDFEPLRKEKRSIKGRIKRRKIKTIVMHPGARWPLKRWPYFTELACALAELRNVKVIITGLKDEVENYDKILYSKNYALKDMMGKTDFAEMARLIKNADLFIGNDTGSAHVASMYGVESLIFLGPTVQQFGFITEQDFHIAENRLPCRPCHVHGGKLCFTGTFECMKNTTVQEALNRVKKILKRR